MKNKITIKTRAEDTIVQHDPVLEVVVEEGAHLTIVVPIGPWSPHESWETTIRIVGKDAQVHIIGVVVGNADRKITLTTMQIHEAPGSVSDLLVKSVLRDTVQFYYTGGIRVEKNAQKTNAYQRNENLLLAPGAKAESKPMLEILANDVRCTHGATVAPINPDQLWYLQTRGIQKIAAEQLIIDGFLESAVSRITDEKVKSDINQLLQGV